MTARIETLGLDLALHCGWARSVNGRIYESGVLDFTRSRDIPQGHNGHAFLALYQWLDANTTSATRIVYELAHHRGGPATRLGAGWQATVQLFAARRSLPVPLSVATMTLKKWATGSGRADKAAMQAWARAQLGRAPQDDNEADAVAVSLWGFMQVKGEKAQ